MIGQTISHYRITAELGRGGMGVVYEAENTRLQKPVALKFLPAELTDDAASKTRFVHEAQAASSLKHHHVCTIHDIDETDDGRLFICMDLYEGGSLKDCVEGGAMDVDEAIKLAAQVADGLSVAHEAGIVHRDIKPANILLTQKGEAVIADFGLAKLSGRTRVTKTGSTVGTAVYMSPEQAQGGDIDYRSDIWSLGVMLYQMLTGVLPFEAGHDAAVAYSIINTNPTPLSVHRTGIPAEVQPAIDRCLAKNPADRYQSAAELRDDLKTLGSGGNGSRSSSEKPAKPKKRSLILGISSIALGIVVVIVALQILIPGNGNAPNEKPRLAVLPFENLGAPEDEYFADGITDEITSKVAVIPGLTVISRTSAKLYKNTGKGLREIGKELGVEYVLEGTIRWDNRGELQKARITAQLIMVSDDSYLWTENYEREIEEIFAVQADIASQIAEALDITLLESERQTFEAKPTENLEAYEAYLRGLDYRWGPDLSKETIQLGIQMFERAVELDPEFALSYTVLSQAHSSMYHFGYDSTEERLLRARAAVDEALELQPELPEAHLALAWYHYWGHQDYEQALVEVAIAERGLPNDVRILLLTSAIWRRQGKFEAAVDGFEGAFALSPQDARIAYNIGDTFRALRRYAEADRYYDLSISLAPDQQYAYRGKAYNYISWLGDTKRARDVLEKMPGKRRDVQQWSLELWRLERNYEAILDFASSASEPAAWLYSLAASTYRLMGEPELAHASYDSARSILEKELDAHPDDNRIHSALGFAYAGLGREEEAVREGKRAVELYPVSKDEYDGTEVVQHLAVIYTMVGEYDAALDEIEYLLSIPGWISYHDLRLDPRWDPLRGHPRFQALLKKFAID